MKIRFLVSGVAPLKCDKKPYSDFGRHFSMEERMRYNIIFIVNELLRFRDNAHEIRC